MSMNIQFIAEREVFVPSINKYDKQIEEIETWQTPTDVTFDIYNAENPVQVYFNWVLSVSAEMEEPIYANDDIFCEREPIRYEKYHPGKIHIEEFKSTLAILEKEGYKVKPILK